MSKQLTEMFGDMKKKNHGLKMQFKELVASEKDVSPLFEDLKTHSVVDCLDKIPQIDELRRISEDIKQTDITSIKQFSDLGKHAPLDETLSK